MSALVTHTYLDDSGSIGGGRIGGGRGPGSGRGAPGVGGIGSNCKRTIGLDNLMIMAITQCIATTENHTNEFPMLDFNSPRP